MALFHFCNSSSEGVPGFLMENINLHVISNLEVNPSY